MTKILQVYSTTDMVNRESSIDNWNSVSVALFAPEQCNVSSILDSLQASKKPCVCCQWCLKAGVF